MAGNKDFQQFNLTEEHEALREAVRDLVAAKVTPRAAEVDETGEFPWDVYEALRASGFHAIHIPEEYGGEGGDALAACLVIEEVARGCASSSLIPAVNKLGTLPLLVAADETLLKTYLPQVASGEAMFSYALSEREAGSDAASMKTRAVRQGRRLGAQRSEELDQQRRHLEVLHRHGRHGPREGPAWRHLGVRRARGRRGLLPRRRPSASSASTARPRARSCFDNCWIPGDRIVGDVGTGFQTAMRTLDHTRVTIGAQAVGIAQGALDVAAAYVKDRQQFGKPVASFQGIQFMIADMAMKLEAARQLVYVAAAKSEREDADLTFFGAAAKAFASDVAMEVTTDAVQALGGAGYTKDWPVERMMRDAKITQIYEGTNQVQRIVMAKQVLR